MKKIICLIDGLGFGGAQRQIIGLASFLQKKNYPIKILSYHKRDFYKPLLEAENIHNDILNPSSKYAKVRDIKLYLKKDNADIIISYLSGPNTITCILKIMGMKAKLIVSERITNQTLTIKDKIRFNLYRFADFIVPNSFSQEKFLKENFPFLREKIVTITNFTDTTHFSPTIKKKTEKEVLEIVIAARISKEKNILAFLDVVKILLLNKSKIHFSWYGNVSVGMDNYMHDVIKKVKELHLENYIDFYSGVDNIKDIYQKSDALCLPSLYEGFPNVICEAMSCGLPILCSNVCDNPYIVDDKINGFLFNPQNIEDMADTIKQFLLLTEEERKTMGEKGRKKVLEICSPEVFVNKYIELIENN